MYNLVYYENSTAGIEETKRNLKNRKYADYEAQLIAKSKGGEKRLNRLKVVFQLDLCDLFSVVMLLRSSEKLLFIGDSITDCGRRYEHPPLGNGYVYQLYLWLSAVRPELRLDIVNKGVSGDTIRDLARRWPVDVLRPQPDWLFVKIGVNDVWRHMAGQVDEAVSLDEFEATYRHLLPQTGERQRPRLVLIEPFLVEPNRDDPFRRRLDDYRAAVRRLAVEFDARLVKTQDAFDRGLRHRPASFWAEDGVHPTAVGHMLIAHEILLILRLIG